MSTQSKGAARERQVAERLRVQGYVVKGHGDAHGTADLIACRLGDILCVQVKANKGSPWMNFRPHEREAMKEEARQAGGRALLVWHPPDRQGARYIFSDSWPINGAESA
jgi:Holliday junction resolvase